jgi:hypothetical protein
MIRIRDRIVIENAHDLGHTAIPLIEAHHNRQHTRRSRLAALGVWIATMAEKVRDMSPWSGIHRGGLRFKRQPACDAIGFAEAPDHRLERELAPLLGSLGPKLGSAKLSSIMPRIRLNSVSE